VYTLHCAMGAILHRYATAMDAIWWGTRGTCLTHFFRPGDIICHVPPHFFSYGLCLERF